jgi:hypothetical protein
MQDRGVLPYWSGSLLGSISLTMIGGGSAFWAETSRSAEVTRERQKGKSKLLADLLSSS